MIISASRRTDIPAFYSDWFFKRLQEGYVLVRNPMNPHQISKISLAPNCIDGYVFWTKNPIPMMNRLNELKNHNYYFQFTLNSYGKDAEPYVPSKSKILIPAFKELALRLGKERVIWRYDPIFINSSYSLDYHLKYFEKLASKLGKYAGKVTISFLNMYKKTVKNVKHLGIRTPSEEERYRLTQAFLQIAQESNLDIDICGSEEKYCIQPSKCIDKERMERICGCNLNISKDRNQRKTCGCCESIDIGCYNSCRHGCAYCYANYSMTKVKENMSDFNSSSPLLLGRICSNDIIHNREVRTCKINQPTFFI